MLEPSLALALSMQSSKGTYALLVGSGISKSSGIPTGWDIVLDLIRKLAILKGEDCGPDPESWFRTLSGTEPDYSDILDQVTRSSAERTQLLRAYFEPNDDQRREGQKLPTPAHRAIAKLVAKGYVRVIITTDFDRLMEQALSDETVQPSVISTIDAIQGALPIVHSPCTIIKVNGDYLDSRLKNTKPELSSYEDPLNKLLDRVFDEFGVIVCGWSGDWDDALRAAVERCNTHRFGTYWALCGSLGLTEEKIIGLRRAAVIKIAGADSFFGELTERIQAIEDFTVTDPISPRVAVSRMKRYLSTDEQRINLHDLVATESERAYKGTKGEGYPVAAVAHLSSEDLLRRLQGYQSELYVLLPVIICGAYWAEPNQHAILLRSLNRLADEPERRNGNPVFLKLRKYPALVLLYGIGLAAIARSNYQLLRELCMKGFSINKYEINAKLRAHIKLVGKRLTCDAAFLFRNGCCHRYKE
jgi:hypothetical protein